MLKDLFYKHKNTGRKIVFFLKEKFTHVFDSILLKINWVDKSISHKIVTNKTIVVVGLELNHRVLKNIKYLKLNSDFTVILLLHRSSPTNDLEVSFYDHLLRFRNKEHIKRLLFCSNKLKLIYGFTSKPSYVKAAIANAKCKTIFDPYDCLVVYYGKNPKQKWMQKEIVDEEFCFQNADGILARNLEAKKSMQYYGVKRENILFSDYCDNDNFITPHKKKLSEISITYTGGIYGRHMMKSSHGIENFFDFIESMNKQEINLHIYPSPQTKPEVYYDYIEEAKRLKYLHVHKTALQKDLAGEISKYHYGVSPHFKEESSNVSGDKLRLGTSLKFFNFLEAGIPILMSSEMEYMAWLVKRYEIGVVFAKEDISKLGSIIRNIDYSQLQKNVIELREKMSMKKDVGRLINFIRSLN